MTDSAHAPAQRLPLWQRWLIALGTLLVLFLACAIWWYHDRSAFEAVLAEASAIGFEIPRPELVVPAERQWQVHHLRVLLAATAAYQDGWLQPDMLSKAAAGTLDSQDLSMLEAARAHWSSPDPQAIEEIERTLDAIGPGPLSNGWMWSGAVGFPGTASDLGDDSEAWLYQRLLLGKPADFVALCRRGDLIQSWDPFASRWRWRETCLRTTATRWHELEAARSDLASLFEDWQADALQCYLELDRAQLELLLQAADSGEPFTDALGVRLPAITEYGIGVIERSQGPGLLRERLQWWQNAQHLPTLRQAREESGKRFAQWMLDPGTLREALSLRKLTGHGYHLTTILQERTQRHLALMSAALRDRPMPLDPISARPYHSMVKDGLLVYEGTSEPELHGRWVPKFVIKPAARSVP